MNAGSTRVLMATHCVSLSMSKHFSSDCKGKACCAILYSYFKYLFEDSVLRTSNFFVPMKHVVAANSKQSQLCDLMILEWSGWRGQ